MSVSECLVPVPPIHLCAAALVICLSVRTTPGTWQLWCGVSCYVRRLKMSMKFRGIFLRMFVCEADLEVLMLCVN